MYEMPLHRFRRIFESVAFASAEAKESLLHLHGVHVLVRKETLHIEATNGHMALQWTEPAQKGSKDFESFLPLATVHRILLLTKGDDGQEQASLSVSPDDGDGPLHLFSLTHQSYRSVGLRVVYEPRAASRDVHYPDVRAVFDLACYQRGRLSAIGLSSSLLALASRAFMAATGGSRSVHLPALVLSFGPTPFDPITLTSADVPELRGVIMPCRVDLPEPDPLPETPALSCDCMKKRTDPVYGSGA